MGEHKGFIQWFIDWIIHNGGLYVFLLVVFAETGLFIGFFFPGDSLLFAAGIWVDDLAREFFGVHWSVIMAMVIVASILGNIAGYWFGYKTGPLLFERKESWLFKRKHLVRAKTFYDKYGKPTIFFAKFLPFIRTFAPIVAGMVKMNKTVFYFYNILGSICWVSIMMLGGHFLNEWVKTKFHFELKDHIEVITVIIVAITTLPVLYKVFFGHKQEVENEPPASNV